MMIANDGGRASQDMSYNPSVVGSAEKSAMADAPLAGGGGADYSTTNLQKSGVDEPEILKSNGEYLFYYTQNDNVYRSYYDGQSSYISIIKTPKKADLSDAEIMKKIKIPATLHNIQLFLQDKYLLILGTRYSPTDSVL